MIQKAFNIILWRLLILKKYLRTIFFRQTIQYLLDNHLFDVRSVILSEGIPASEFGGHDKTNSLDFNKNGKPETVFVERYVSILIFIAFFYSTLQFSQIFLSTSRLIWPSYQANDTIKKLFYLKVQYNLFPCLKNNFFITQPVICKVK